MTARRCSSSASKTEMRRWALQMRHHAFSKRLVAPHRYASVGVGLRQQQSAVPLAAQTLSFWVAMTARSCSSSASRGGMRRLRLQTQRQQERNKAIATPDAAPRFQQAPGGDATISLADKPVQGAPSSQTTSTRGPVGGAATIVLGIDDPAEMFG